MSRNAKMRPATAPAGSRMTASVTESQTSSPPRRIETRRSPAGVAAGLSSRWSTSLGVRPSASSVGTPVIRSAAAFQRTTCRRGRRRRCRRRCSRGSRRCAPARARPLVELGVRERGRRVRGERRERLDLLLAPGARAAAVDREHAVHAALRADERDAEVRGVAGGEQRVGLASRSLAGDVGTATGVRDWTTSPASRAVDGARASRARLGASAAAGVTTSSSPSSSRIDARVGAEQRRRLRDDLVEHGLRVELGGEQAAGAGELLRERARAALRLEELAALERAAGGAGEVARELEVVVGEARAPRAKKTSDERRTPRCAAPRPGRPAARGSRSRARRSRHSSSKRSSPSSRGAASTRPSRAAARSGAGRLAEPVCEELREQPRESSWRPRAEPSSRGISTAATSPPSASDRGLRQRVERLVAARAAGRARSRCGRSRAGPRLARALARSSRRCAARARRGSRTPRAGRRRVWPNAAPSRACRRRARRAPRRPSASARRSRSEALVAPGAGPRPAGPRSRRRARAGPARSRDPARPRSAGNSKPTSSSGEAVHRGAAQHPAVRVEQVAVGRVGTEQRRRPRRRAAAAPCRARARS